LLKEYNRVLSHYESPDSLARPVPIASRNC
jgi:hypothetical protein